MTREQEMDNIIERIYHLETAYKGFTTRLRLLEGEVDKLNKNNGRIQQ